jgi:hypothetical protein
LLIMTLILILTYVGTAALGCRPGEALRLLRPCPELEMRKTLMLVLGLLLALALSACSPRDFLTRRLAADLISASDAFKTPRQFPLQTGIISNKDFVSPDYLVLQQHGWISASTARCSSNLASPPCWDVVLTPSGVETVRALVPAEEADKTLFSVPVARRELVSVSGISKLGNVADVDFTWRWIPLNEIGAALYSGDVRYNTTVEFRDYDDGWRIVLALSAPRSGQRLDDALKNTEPAP